MSERGMKKWRPFKSLPEYEEYYQQMIYERQKISKPLLSEDQQEEINAEMISLRKEDEVKISYYDDGFIRKTQGTIREIEPYDRYLRIDGLVISFDNLLSLRHN
jgi:hypothetical protein